MICGSAIDASCNATRAKSCAWRAKELPWGRGEVSGEWGAKSWDLIALTRATMAMAMLISDKKRRMQHDDNMFDDADSNMCCSCSCGQHVASERTCRYPATRQSYHSHSTLKYPSDCDMMCRVFQQLSALPFAVCGNSVRLQSRNLYKLNNVMLPPFALAPQLEAQAASAGRWQPAKEGNDIATCEHYSTFCTLSY